MPSSSLVKHRCPQCGSPEVDRLRRSFLQRVFSGRRRKYQCAECQHRFLDWPTGEAELYVTAARRKRA